MLAGGGTGGGVYPALAVAEALRADDRHMSLCWVGSLQGVERELVTRNGLDFHGVPAGPLHGVNPLRAVASLAQNVRGIIAARRVIRGFQPDALLVTGGWVSLPVALAAWLRNVPIMVLMPDIEPGLAIKMLARIARRVAVPAERSLSFFRPGKAVELGYAVRSELANAVGQRAEAIAHFGLESEMLTLLVFGGSRGARSINRAITVELEALLAHCQIIHISGSLDWAEVSAIADRLPDELRRRYHARDYLHDDMGLALAAADLVVSRAGASILGEFPNFGLPAIVVPYPHAWRYQKVNADYLVERGAAIRLDDAALETELLPGILRLIQDAEARNAMAQQARGLAVPDAAARVAAELNSLAQESRGKL